MSGLTRLALFGRPIKASLSPVIQRLFADQFGLNLKFEMIETGPEGFARKLRAFRQAGGIGCNITLPLKHDAWKLAAESSAQATRARASNTLVSSHSGWIAHNTDGAGLSTDLSVNNGIDLGAKRILIIGAGGAVAGVLGSLLAARPDGITLVNRNQDRASALTKQFSALGKIDLIPWQKFQTSMSSRSRQFDLVINATSLGHHGRVPPVTKDLFASGGLCYDLNYFKAGRPLRDHCKEMGQAYMDGLGMLVEQAAKSFHIWTGQQPATNKVIEACRRDYSAQ